MSVSQHLEKFSLIWQTERKNGTPSVAMRPRLVKNITVFVKKML